MARNRTLRAMARLLWPRVLKRFTPTSLFGRSLLIIILPVGLMQVAVTWAFFDAHWRTVTSRLSAGLAGDIAWVSQAYQTDPAHFAATARRAEETLDLSVVFQDGRGLPTERGHSFFGAIDGSLNRALQQRLHSAYWFDTTRYPAYVDIRVKTAGGVLRFIAPRDRAFATQGGAFVMWLAGATILLTAVAVLFIRNQVRAIERLADAADAFGRGADVEAFRPHGAREVRRAAQAFLAMKARIGRHIEQRTALLASVSHDLRTPLTRLKLELALAEPDERIEEMKGDLAEMEHMIDEYLDFARGEGGESPDTIHLAALLEEVAQSAARTGVAVVVSADADLVAPVRPNALRRAISNLVMNAAAHGERVELSARALASGGLQICVDDDGPGIPDDRFEDAVKPFQRLDESRNQNIKGVGLGLSIARDVARSHGGDLILDRSPLGGLRAVIRLPG